MGVIVGLGNRLGIGMDATTLTRKIPWDQKLIICYLGNLWYEKFFFFFFWTSKLHISQAPLQHQARQILILYEPLVNFCFK
jgi:hypothetical protein